MRGVIKFDLFIACVACLAWTAAVALVYFLMPRANYSITMFVLIGGAALLFPWVFIVWTILHRAMSKADAIAKSDDT